MRAITSMQAQWKAETQSGDSLRFENCKGGYFSDKEEYGLKVVGKTETSGNKNILQTKNGSVTQNGVAFTAVDGRITASGTPNGGGGRLNFGDIFPPFSLSAGVTYCFSVTGSFEGVNLMVSNLATGSAKSVIPRNGTSGIYTPTQDETVYVGFNLSASYAIAIDGYFQCEVGSEPTEYEPYGGDVRCVKKGTAVTCENTVLAPCDLQEGDVWWPMTGKVVRADGTVVQYPPQTLYAAPGTVTVSQEGEALLGTLSATMLVRR